MHVTRRIRIAALGVLVVPTLALVLSASPAGAAGNGSGSSGTNTSGFQTGLICATNSGTAPTVDNLLPMNRWSGAVSNEHVRLPGGFFSSVTNAPSLIQRQGIVSGLTAAGASEWQIAGAMTEGASQFCFANSVGTMANTMTAKLGNALIASPLIVILAILALLSILWRSMKGRENPLRHLAKFVAIVAILFVVVGAAAGSTVGHVNTLSPAGLIQDAFNAVSMVSSGPANAIGGVANSTIGNGNQQTIAKSDPLSCYWYNKELVNQYQSAYQKAGSYGYVVPSAMNSLWEQSVIPTYINEQFGASNNYGPLVYCHLLEDQASIQPRSQMGIALAASNLTSFGPTQPASLAWNGSLTSNQTDESMVAWAACQSPTGGFKPTEWDANTGSTIPSAFTTIANPTTNPASTVTGADCAAFWQATAPAAGGTCGDGTCATYPSDAASSYLFNPDRGSMNWGDNPSAIATATNSSAAGVGIANYLGNLHGTQNSGAMTSAFFFLLTSTVIFVIFGALALALIVAKLSLIIWMIVMPLVLLASLLPSGAGRVGKYAKHLFGLVLFATMAGLILSFVSIITSVLANVGSTAFGTGSLLAQVFITIAPVSAILLVKKGFKLMAAPSPFSIRGASGFAGALGGFGGAVAGGDVVSHMMNKSKSAAQGMGKNAMGRAKGAVRGGTSDGSNAGSMSKRGRGSKMGTGAAAGVGAGMVAPASGDGGGPSTQSGSTGSPSTPGSAPTPDDSGTVTTAPIIEGAAIGTAGSMFRKPKVEHWDTDMAAANRMARAETRQRVARNARRAGGSALHSVLHPIKAGKNSVTALATARQSMRDSFVSKDATGKSHALKGTGRLLRDDLRNARVAIPKIAKYGALGLGAVAVGGFGAVPLGIGAAGYGLHRLHKVVRGTPQRSEHRLATYKNFQVEEENRRKQAEADVKADNAKKVEEEKIETARTEQEQKDEAARVEKKAKAERARQAKQTKAEAVAERAAQERLDRQRQEEVAYHAEVERKTNIWRGQIVRGEKPDFTKPEMPEHLRTTTGGRL
jgi:hypothetical protein